MKQFIMMKSLIITLLCSFCLSTTNAQSYFRQCGIQLLTKQNGLSNNTLTGIYQDKAGFLWLGTDVGLSRYDGIHFHNYNLIDKEPRALTHLYETSNNLLWSHIANLNQIACFDKMRGIYMPLISPTPEVYTGYMCTARQIICLDLQCHSRVKYGEKCR